MKNQTAVEWLLMQMDLETISKYDKQLLKAIAMEKEQIIEAYTDEDNIQWDRQLRIRAAEQYYKQTYNL
jgi:hypothetical protein